MKILVNFINSLDRFAVRKIIAKFIIDANNQLHLIGIDELLVDLKIQCIFYILDHYNINS